MYWSSVPQILSLILKFNMAGRITRSTGSGNSNRDRFSTEVHVGDCRWLSATDSDDSSNASLRRATRRHRARPIMVRPSVEIVHEQPSVEEVINVYLSEGAARTSFYASSCYLAMVELASHRIYTEADAQAAFRRHPDHGVVRAVVNHLINQGWTGHGEPPQM